VGPLRAGDQTFLRSIRLFERTFPKVEFETVSDWYEGFRLIRVKRRSADGEGGGLTDLAHEEVFQATRWHAAFDLRLIIEG